MTFLDGLGTFPQLSALSQDALQILKTDALGWLHSAVPLQPNGLVGVVTQDPERCVQLGPFSILRGPQPVRTHLFNLQAPTTRDNAVRVARACQLTKPILLEGSPGVGKTSLITALANITGHHLCRINLSDQTDLIDLFGSDLPVEGGKPGEFAWKEAEFLRALQEGHWVLLDEMNLAPQSVLEGLNAVLDHRGTVYIPELGRSFARHPSFRIFAAQNPLAQGGGRKGLPKSFMNRFTKVYVQELSPDDLLLVCQHLFPDYPTDILRGMIAFNARLSSEVTVHRSFGKDGAPWEFNLRDVVRWAHLLRTPNHLLHPSTFLETIFLGRFRKSEDKQLARALFQEVFPGEGQDDPPHFSRSASHLRIGHAQIARGSAARISVPTRLLQAQLASLETAALCVTQGWLVILTGGQNTGKKQIVGTLASMAGHKLCRISINGATDTTDILGSFEQVDPRGHVLSIVQDASDLMDQIFQRSLNLLPILSTHRRIFSRLLCGELLESGLLEITNLVEETLKLLSSIASEPTALQIRGLQTRLLALCDSLGHGARFEWVDGPLVRALKDGHWLLLENANLCNPSVLDRLNSLCESGGNLILSERGHVQGKVETLKPHPNFRLFMTVDPRFGELSRAMRNRGIELHVLGPANDQDFVRLLSHHRLPLYQHRLL